MASKEDAERTLMKFIAGFLRAMASPPRNREDPLIRQLDCWAPALDGSNLVMIGRPLWQLASEDHAILTTRLIHITPDLQWALTLDHWYALGGSTLTLPERVDETGRVDRDVPLTTELTAIPMSAARRAMEQFPSLLRELAERDGHDDCARWLREIEVRWVEVRHA